MEKASQEETGDQETKEKSMEIEEADNSQALLIAVPPPLTEDVDEHTELVLSPALKNLDDLYKEGLLSSTKVSYLKQKYTELHKALSETRNNVIKLNEEHTFNTSNMHRITEQLEKANKYPKNIVMETEASKLRETLLRYKNRHAEVEERLYHLEFKIECMKDEREILEKNASRLPKEEELEEKAKDMQKSQEEMKKEIFRKRQELKQLQEDHSNTYRLYKRDEHEFEKVNTEISFFKNEYLEISVLPNQVAKEAEKLTRKKNEVQQKKKQAQTEYNECLGSMMELQKEAIQLDKENSEIQNEIDQTILTKLEMEAKIDHQWKVFEQTKEKVAQMKNERDELEISLCQALVEKKKAQEMFTLKTREKERDMKQQKKSELQLKIASDNYNQVKSIFDKINAEKEAMPGVDEELQKRKKELIAEKEQISKTLELQKSSTPMEHVKLKLSLDAELSLLYDQIGIRTELNVLKRLSSIKTEERDQKAREKKRADIRYRDTKGELTSQYIVIEDHKKIFQEKKSRLKIFAKKYELIKKDRNKYVSLIQTCTQNSREMREKIKILQNEIEILRTAVLQKGKQLHKERLRHMHSVVFRDSLRNELDKQHKVAIELDECYDQQKLETIKLNYLINNAEEQIIKMRKRYQSAIQERNKKGETLIKLSSEVCLFYEKYNAQKELIKRGNIEMEDLDYELRLLSLQKNFQERELNLLQKELPGKQNLLEELASSQIQLSDCRKQIAEFEKQAINRTDDGSTRFLAGNDPTPEVLQDKIKKVEMRLAEVEMQLMEKELIDEHVTRLSDQLKGKVNLGKEDTLELAKKINDLQRRIKETTEKMMSLTAELSMKQASSIVARRELDDMELLLEQCYFRMERGEAPTDELEQEWAKLMQREQQRRLQQLEKRMMKKEENLLEVGGIISTAEQRPNAYIPDDETELPIPRPYGKHAPFKPSETGSSIRHIRKPNPKPIEI